jgi:hypothetical protein
LAYILGCNPTWTLNLRYGLLDNPIHVSGRHCALRVVMRQSRTSDGIEMGMIEFGGCVGSFHLVAPLL